MNRINWNEPQASRQIPKRPRGLRKAERLAWDGLLGRLSAIGLATETDRESYLEYCRICADLCELRGLLQKDGWLMDTISGGEKIHPAATKYPELLRHKRQWLEQFGLTPTGRSRLSVEPTPVEQSQGLAKYLT